jgi:hypothetical protein
MPRRQLIPILAAAALIAGCAKAKPKEIPISQILPYIPLPPDPEPLVRENGTEAIQFVIVSRQSSDSVTNYYRQLLGSDPFRLINERKSGTSTQFYAEQDGPSIWITVSPNGSSGSQITIAGAKDTTSRKVLP